MTYTVNFSVMEGGTVDIEKAESESISELPPATATPDEGWHFIGWYAGEDLLYEIQTITYEQYEDRLRETVPNINIVAKFEKDIDKEPEELPQEEPAEAINEAPAPAMAPMAANGIDDAAEPEAPAEEDVTDPETEPTEYTVTFIDDGETVATVTVEEGQPIDDKMPADPVPEAGYSFKGWFNGTVQITASTVVETDITAVAEYEQNTFSVTFTNGETTVSYQIPEGTSIGSYLPEDPEAPEKYQFSGWFEGDTQITEETIVNRDISATARFEQVYVTVTFYVGETEYVVRDVLKDNAIGTLPNDPVAEGKKFNGWVSGETPVSAETVVSEDTDIYAVFTDLATVRFIMNNGTGEELVTYFEREAGTVIGNLPETPYQDGYEFVRWYNQETLETVTAETEIPAGGLVAVAEFKEVKIYTVTAEYYYMIDGERVIFDHDVFEITDDDFDEEGKYTITVPASTQVDQEYDPEEPIYYPSEPQIVILLEELPTETTAIEKKVEYVSHTAIYSFVYYLKNLSGNDYSVIERVDNIKGVYGSFVTPEVKEYPYADFERVEAATITQEEGQELNVYYTRKEFRLSYYTDGGSYIESVDAPYGTTVAVTSEEPERTGYEFAGWYLDADLTQEAGSSVKLDSDTTLYAKWEGARVNYSIVYYKEKYENGTINYVYDNSRTGTGKVGETVYATNAPDLINNINGYEKDTAKNAESTAVIKADGSSVLKVYYKLIRYTLVFNANQGTININGSTYTGSNYRISNVVLGQEIGSLWPSSSTEIYRNNRYFDGWTGGPATYITKQYELVWNHVTNANNSHVMTFTAAWDNSSYNRDAEYWLQQADGTWKAAPEYTQIGLNTNNLGAKEIDGYTKHNDDGSAPRGYAGSGNTTKEIDVWIDGYHDVYEFNGGDTYDVGDTFTRNGHTYTVTSKTERSGWHPVHPYSYIAVCDEEGHYEKQTVTRYTYRFYYDRSQYTITYYDGSTVLKTTDPIYFEADISGGTYNYVPETPEGKEDYEWGGWYNDSDLSNPYTFTKMPGHNVAVYAKWIAPQFTVTYDLQGGNADFATSVTVNKNDTVDFPGTPTKTGYEFAGWWTEAEESSMYDWNAPITDDITIYAHWKQETLSYTVHYYEQGTTTKLLEDKVVKNPAFVIGNVITETALSVTGYRPDEGQKSVTLSSGENTIIFYYTQKTKETSYTVEYVLEDNPDIHVRESKTVTVDGSTVSVKETAHDVDAEYVRTHYPDQAEAILADSYHPVKATQELVLGSDVTKNIITFKYANYKTAKVTVRYLDMDGGNIIDPVETMVKVGASFTAETKNLNGWVLHHSDGNLQFKVENTDPVTISFYYQKKLSLIAKNKSKSYDGTALVSNGLNDLVQTYKNDLRPGHSLTSITFEGSQTESGSSPTTPSNAVISGASSEYYLINYISGRLTVNPISVIINMNADRWDGPTYDGQPKTFGFRDQGHEIEINNALYKEKYLSAIQEMVEKLNETHTDAGRYTIPANTIRSTVTLPVDHNFKVTLNVRAGLLVIHKAPLTITTGTDTKEYDGTPLTKDEKTITGLVKNETATVTVTGSQTEVGSSANTYEITWGTAKQSNYEVNNTLGTLTVTERAAEVKLTAASGSKTYDGTELTNTEVTATGLPEGFTVEATASGSQTDAGESANVVDDGYKIFDAAGNDKTANFTNVTKVDGTLTVTPKEVTVTTGSDSKKYDGTALTKDEANITGLVNNETAAVTATGSQIEVGSSSNTYSIDWGTTNKDNYQITETLGTLTVTKNDVAITLTAGSDEKTYDGTALTNSVVTAEGLPEGFTVTATTSGSQTDAGESANKVATYIIKDAAGAEKTANFTNVTKVDGKLTVNKAPLTVTTLSGEKPYDGTALTAEGTISGFVNGETATFATTGTQTDVGESKNTYSLTWDGTAKEGNYEIAENIGTLKVTANDTEVKLTAGSGTKPYDGTALTNDEVTASGLPTGFTVTATTSGSQTDAGQSANVVNDGYVIKNAAGKDKTANFTNVKTVNGTLTVTKVNVTVTTGSAEKEYDGTPLTKDEANITGLVNDETVEIHATGSQTDVGSKPNTYEITWGSVNKDNYEITEKLGSLEVKVNTTDQITLTAPSGDKVYDGKPLTADGTGEKKVTASGLPEGFTVEATATGSQTDAGQSNNTVNDGFIIRDKEGNNVTSNFEKISKVNGKLTVTKAPVTITTGSAEKVYDGAPLTKDEKSITGLVDGEKVTITVTGTQTAVGSSDNTYTIDWGTTNKDNYEVTDVLGRLTVTETTAKITVTTTGGEFVYDGQAHGATVEVTGVPEGYRVDTAVSNATATDVTTEDVEAKADTLVIKNKEGEDVTAKLDITYVNGSIKITPAPATVTTGSASKPYDGTALTKNEAGITGLVNGETATVTASGSQIDVGHSDNTYSIEWGTAKATNYTITENLGTLEVTESETEVILTAPSDEKVYDGTALTADGTGDKKVTASGLPTGFTVEATASGSQTDAGESANKVNTGYVIRNEAGEDKTSSFTNVHTVDGTLKVTPKEVTVRTGSLSKEYDGSALTCDEAEINGLVEDEYAGVTTTGSQIEVGSSDNTYTITWGTAKEGNYTVKEELGTLEVIKRAAEVTLTAPSDEKTYDGTPLTADGTGEKKVIAEGLPEGFTVEATASGSQTDAGESANKVNDGYVIKNAAGEDKTANFTNVVKVDGTLKVTPKAVTIKVDDAEKVYGEADPAFTGTVEGLVKEGNLGEITYKRTNTAEDVGEYKDVLDAAYTANDNYTVTVEQGDFEITKAEMTLTVGNYTGVYDGAAHTVKVTPSVTEGTKIYYHTGDENWSETAPAFTDVKETPATVYVKADNPNYESVTESGTVTITKAAITLTDETTVTYNGEEQQLVLNAADATGVVAGETLGFKDTPTVKGTNAGTYKDVNYDTWYVTKANDDDSTGNYELNISGTLTITPKAITVKADDKTKVYDNDATTDPELTATVTGAVEGDTIKYSLSREEGQNVGEYAITVTVTAEENPNYTVSAEGGTFKITPKAITVKADDKTKVYDNKAETDPELTATVTGAVTGDTINYMLSREEGQDVKDYAITVTAGENPNYTVSVEGGTFSITPAELTITVKDQTYSYNGQPRGEGNRTYTDGFDAKVTVDGLKGEDALTSITLNGQETNAGTYKDKIVASNAEIGNATGNYTIKYVAGTLIINKATSLTLNVKSYENVYDGQPHTVTAEVSIPSGTKIYYHTGDENWSETAPTYTDVPETPKTVYVKAENPNYETATGSGTVTITKATITLTGEKTVTYNGGEQKLELDATKAAGLVEGETLGFEDTPTVKGTYAGTYKDVNYYTWFVKKADGAESTWNYDIEVTGTLTINPLAITVKADDKTKVYDNDATTDPALTATVTGAVEGDTIKYSLSREEGQNVGEYAITVTVTAEENPNYTVSAEGGTFKITPKAITVKADDKTKVYDNKAETDPELTATVTGAAAGDTINYMLSREEGQDVGEYPIIVTLGDNPNYDVEAGEGTFEITPKAVTIKVDDAEKVYGEADPAFTGTVTGLVNEGDLGEITYKRTNTDENVGTYQNVLAATFSTNNNYTVTVTRGDFEITQAPINDFTVENPKDVVYNGQSQTQKPVVKDSKGNTLAEGTDYTLSYGGDTTNAGTVTVTITGTGNYEGETSANYQIKPAPVTITTGSDSKEYDGTALTKDEANITGLVNNETATVTATGSQIEVGSGSNTYSIDWGTTNKDNYKVTESLGTLEVKVNTAKVTLTAANDSKTYDGKPLTNDKVTAAGLPEGFTVEATASGSQKDVGECANVVNDGYVIKNTAGEDKTANFTNVTKVDGKLTVTKATLTITTPSDEKQYDGTALTAEGTISGFVNGETATFTTTGTQTDVGESENTYTLTWDGSTKESNYEITENIGTLKVTVNTKEIKVTASSAQKEHYDGEPLSFDNVEVSGLPEGFTVEAVVTGTQTDAGESDNVVERVVIKDRNGKDVTAYFNNIKPENGRLIVGQAELMVVTESASKAYDGTPLTAPGEMTGLVKDETASFEVVGSQTEVGFSGNGYTVTFDGTAKEGNYRIVEQLGVLTVTEADISDKDVFDISEPEDVEYNGKEQKQTITVTTKDGMVSLEAGKDFTVTYSDDVTNVGTVTVTITGTGGYTGTVTRTYDITPKEVTVTAENKTKVAGSADPALTARVTGLIGDETIKYTLSRAAGETAGTYAITPAGAAVQGNYTVKFAAGTLTITAAPAPAPDDDDDDPTPTPTPIPVPVPEPALNPETAANPTPRPMPQPAAVPAAEPDAEPTPETIVPEPSATPAPSSAPAEPAETVKPEEPQEQTEYWAVLNLIATVITSLIGLGMLITFFRKKKDDEEAENTDGVTRTDDQNSEAEDENRRRKSKLLGLIPAAASIILFALTENMTNQMGLTDKWTIWMAALCLINIVLAYLTRNRTKDDSESKPENESAA